MSSLKCSSCQVRPRRFDSGCRPHDCMLGQMNAPRGSMEAGTMQQPNGYQLEVALIATRRGTHGLSPTSSQKLSCEQILECRSCEEHKKHLRTGQFAHRSRSGRGVCHRRSATSSSQTPVLPILRHHASHFNMLQLQSSGMLYLCRHRLSHTTR